MKEIRIPDIGGADNVDVIEVLVAVGDTVEQEQSLITLESEKASMEIPSPVAGVIKELKVAVGDKVSEGDLIAMAEVAEAATESAPVSAAKAEEPEVAATAEPEVVASAEPVEQDIVLPDLGTDGEVDVISIDIHVDDEITKDDAMLTLESEKASMEVPAPHSGKVLALSVKVGDKVSSGTVIGRMLAVIDAPKVAPKQQASKAPTSKAPAAAIKPASLPGGGVHANDIAPAAMRDPLATPVMNFSNVYAGPSVRRLARELGVDLTRVKGSGQKGRVTKFDLKQYAKSMVQQAQSGAGGNSLPIDMADLPKVDFSKFGEIDVKPLSKIKKLTARNMARNWVMVPHVTQFDEADITDMEAFRKEHKGQAEARGFKFSPLVFVMKALALAMEEFPQFNSSLEPGGENLIYKKYIHIGIAIDTPNGLVVGVVRDVDKKGLLDLAEEVGALSTKAREKGLTMNDMAGSCMTISSLGGISGTAFTPIVNLPEVAILGVSKSKIQPVYCDGEFIPRLMLPLSLSYDHRVIDGAEAARFTKFLGESLADIRLLSL